MSEIESKRTAAATAGRMRKSEERMAARLAARGWVCVPPDHPCVDFVRGFTQDGKARA